jgi:hypothetical protein
MSSTDQGTGYFVWDPPRPWPPMDVRSLVRSPAGDCSICISGHPDGHLDLIVSRSDGTPVCAIASERLAFSGAGVVLVTVRWQGPNCTLFINSRELDAYQPDAPPRVFQTSDFAPGPLSIDHPDGAAACHEWIENRKAKFSSTGQVRRNRRSKELQEQAHDLRDALAALSYVLEGVKGGKLYLRGHLAAELRALVYWQNDTQRENSYNPLLLRLASKEDLPLPMYAMREPGIDAPAVLHEADLHFTGSFPEVIQTAPGQELMDLQEWLLTPVVIDRSSGTARTISQKELISECANTLGSSHYDEDTSEFVDLLKHSSAGAMDVFTGGLMKAAGIVVFMGQWVLAELGKRGRIT